MNNPTVYLETTLIGHLVGRIHPDTVIAARQTITRDWWAQAAPGFQLVASQLVAEECSAGDAEVARERLSVLEKVDYIEITDDSRHLAASLMEAGAIPDTEPRDALHISIAATNGVQYLLTWSFKHMANAAMREQIERVCRDSGFEPPVICTPEELTGEYYDS